MIYFKYFLAIAGIILIGESIFDFIPDKEWKSTPKKDCSDICAQPINPVTEPVDS